MVQRIDKTLPDIAKAPIQVTTETHLYYAEQAIENENKSVTMMGWYEYTNKKWVPHQEEITLPLVLHPKVGKRT